MIFVYIIEATFVHFFGEDHKWYCRWTGGKLVLYYGFIDRVEEHCEEFEEQ